MSSFNKSKTIMVTLLTCATFGAHAAWWDAWKTAGDDGNVNTQGNAAAAANKGKTPQAVNKSYVGLFNQTNSILTSAVLKDKAGNALYTSTAGRTCAAGAVCWLRVPAGLMKKGNTFFFYSNNKLVSAYMIDNQPINAPLYNIGASMDSLGVYVLSKIRTVNPKVTYTRVDNDIQTTTLSATPYQELADYYLDLMGNAKDSSAQETKVIKSLADQFAKNIPIPANSATPRLSSKKPVMAKAPQKATTKLTLKSSAPNSPDASSSPLCSDTLRSSMGWLSLIPMIGDVVKTAAETAQSASCPSADQDVKDIMANQFNRVNAKLDDIRTQLTELENQLKTFEQDYKTDKLSDQKTGVDKLDDQFTIWRDQYQQALLISVGADGKPRNSINEIISSFSSFDAAMKKNPKLAEFLDRLYDNNSEYQAVVDLAHSENFTTARITKLCGSTDTIAGNVFDIRAMCNATVIQMYSRNILLEKQMEYASSDVDKVYALDNRSDKVKKWMTIPETRFTAWVNNIENMNPEKAIVRPVQTNEPVYNLANNLIAKGFQVNGWYPEADKRYLDVAYDLGNGNLIKSRYAYQHPTRDGEAISYAANADIDSDIVNVMGVPVPERFFSGGGKDRNNYGADEAFPWADKTQLAYQTSDKKNDGWHWYDTFNPYADFTVPASANVAIHAKGFNVANISSSNLVQAHPFSATREQKGTLTYSRQIFDRITPTSYRVSYYGADWYLIGGGEYFTFMRYTSSNGYSYLWAIRTWLAKEVYGIELNGAEQCMTNDCYIKNTGQKMDRIGFKNGPNFEWTYTNKSHSTDYNIDRDFTLSEMK